MAWSRLVRLVAAVICVPVSWVEVQAFPSKQIINTNGPITRVVVGEDGSLQIEHQDYPGIGQFFPPMAWPADCGVFLRHNGTVDGMDYARHDGTMVAYTQAAPFRPISQVQSTDGQLVCTVMDNSTDGTGVPFKVTQYVSCFPGDPWILVTVIVNNQSATNQTVDLFAAADIYLARKDESYGYLNLECPQVAIGGLMYYSTNDVYHINTLFLQAAPGVPQPTAYQEDGYATIWTVIGNNQHFADTTNFYMDNGAGLEWQTNTIPAGGSFSTSFYWAFGTDTLTCVDPPDRPQPLRIFWSGGTNMVLHWDQPGYVLQASTNAVCHWDPLPVPITDTEATVPIDRHNKTFYRLALP